MNVVKNCFQTNEGLAPILSVIVPAYNAGATIARTVESIRSQTLPNLEIWVVDDGSTDDTPRLADEFSVRDSRVHVIHQPNCGCYMARLTALKQVHTKYFGFVDADDAIAHEMFEKMVSTAEENNLDVVQVEYEANSDRGGYKIAGTRDEVLDMFVKPYLVYGRKTAHIWDKIYRNNYDFNVFLNAPIMMFEDFVFNLQFYMKVKRMGWLHENLYDYAVSSTSSVKNYRPRNLADFGVAIRARIRYLPEYGIAGCEDAEKLWIVTNLLNLLVIAATSAHSSFCECCRNVREVLESDICRSVIGGVGAKERMLGLMTILPSFMIVALLRFVRLLWRTKKAIMRMCQEK